MTTEVHDILEAARALPPLEQLEVMQGLAQSLAQSLASSSIPVPSALETASSTFWQQKSLAEIAHEQPTPIFHGASDLRRFSMPDWPTDETTDDLLEFLHDQRRADRNS